MHKNIVLIGMPGSGKSTVGKLLAHRLNRTFCDVDAELVRRTGVSIATIFEIEGEAGFRIREANLLQEILPEPRLVIATGGGAILDENNRAAIRHHGFVIYLRATVSELLARTRHDRNRPLLQHGNPLHALEQMMHVRAPIYADVADLVIDTGRQHSSLLVEKLIPLIRVGEGGNQAEEKLTVDKRVESSNE